MHWTRIGFLAATVVLSILGCTASEDQTDIDGHIAPVSQPVPLELAGTDIPDAVARFVADNPMNLRTFHDRDGRRIDRVIVGGRPPAQFRMAPAIVGVSASSVVSDVPAFDWSYGCSATSAAMLAGYYDRTGYTNMYVGPTNGGVMPLSNSVWGTGECPLSATHLGFDGRVVRGHVDDYWVAYESPLPDP